MMNLRGLALALCGALLAACGEGTPAAGASGAAARSIEVVDLEGLEAALEAQRGKGLLLNFWAIWCPPCVAELPELVEVYHEFRERGGVVIGLSYDLMVPGSDPATIHERMRGFMESKGLDYPVLVYDEADFDGVNERFDLPGEIPVTLAIDRAGTIVDRQLGSTNRARFAELMRAALGD